MVRAKWKTIKEMSWSTALVGEFFFEKYQRLERALVQAQVKELHRHEILACLLKLLFYFLRARSARMRASREKYSYAKQAQ